MNDLADELLEEAELDISPAEYIIENVYERLGALTSAALAPVTYACAMRTSNG